MSRRALSMSAVLGLIVASGVWTGAVWPGAAQAGDASGRDSRESDAAEADSRFIPPRSADTTAQKIVKPVRAGQRSKASGGGWWTTLGGLVAVLALVFLAARILKKSVPAAQKTLPPEVVQVLGRKALDYRHTVHLVRFGSRMLMIGTSQEGMTALSEITDPVEIDYLAGLCKPSEPASVAHSFNQLFQKFQSPEPLRKEVPPATAPANVAASDPEADVDEDADSDPAILRLQERLKQSKRADLSARSVPPSGNAPPATSLQSTPFQSTESRG